MAVASAGLCGEELATPTMSVMLFRIVVLNGLDRGPRALDSLVFLMKNFPCSRPMDRVVFGAEPPENEETPGTLHVEPVEGIRDGSIRGESGQVESPDDGCLESVSTCVLSRERRSVNPF